MMKTLYVKIRDPVQDMKKICGAARLLVEGKLVAFPTETVYGLGGNALDEKAVAAIFEAKGRPLDNPMIVHIASPADLGHLCREVPPQAKALAARFWPGPLTLVLPAREGISPLVTGGLATVALRIPRHPVALALIRAAAVPVAAPSANRSGRPSPTRASHVLEDLDGRIAAVLDWGPCSVGVESTVLDMEANPPRILRPGGVTLEELQQVLPRVLPAAGGPVAPGEAPPSPGVKYRHYAPRSPLYLLLGEPGAVRQKIRNLCSQYREKGLKVGLLAASSWETPPGCLAMNLAGKDDPQRAASLLFAFLRDMDGEGVDVILAEGLPEQGMGAAVMNRLRKAAGKNILPCD